MALWWGRLLNDIDMATRKNRCHQKEVRMPLLADLSHSMSVEELFALLMIFKAMGERLGECGLYICVEIWEMPFLTLPNGDSTRKFGLSILVEAYRTDFTQKKLRRVRTVIKEANIKLVRQMLRSHRQTMARPKS